LVAGGLHGGDEAFYVKFAFAAEAAVIDSVFVKAPGAFEDAVV